MTSLEVLPVAGALGARVTGIDLVKVVDGAQLDTVRRALADHLVVFLPDQHLGRNTALSMGFEAPSMVVWDPRRGLGGLEDVEVKQATFLLWKGHCSVHQRFRPEHVAAVLERLG